VGPAWLVIPTYNEAATIVALVEAALVELHRHAPGAPRVLVVDDASPDGTGRLADALAARRPGEVEVLHRPGKAGLGTAYLAGFARALAGGAGRVLQMDGDGSHDPADLGRLLAATAPPGGADLALGSRYVPGGGVRDWGPLRRALSRGGSAYARLVLGLPQRDLTGGLKCWRASALRALDLPAVRSQGYAFQVELTYRAVRAGLRVVEVPIVFADRRAGSSKMTPRIAVEAALLLPRLRRAG
jgi:dolichol-phosphate mannosyltransferase